MTEKRQFLLGFDEFLEGYDGKCYFEMVNGQRCQGWIYEIHETSFTFLDSGPLANDSLIIFAIEDVNIHSFAYWNGISGKWDQYPGL